MIGFTNNQNKDFIIFVNLFLYSIVLYGFFKRKMAMNLKFSLAIIFTILFSMHALVHDLTLLLIPIFLFLNRINKKNKTAIYSITILLYLFPLVVLLNNVFFGTLILLFLGIFLFFRGDLILNTVISDDKYAVNPQSHK